MVRVKNEALDLRKSIDPYSQSMFWRAASTLSYLFDFDRIFKLASTKFRTFKYNATNTQVL